MERFVKLLKTRRLDELGKNAAECHHEPDDTVWNGREPVLVDMGVKLDGVCSDLTRSKNGSEPGKISARFSLRPIRRQTSSATAPVMSARYQHAQEPNDHASVKTDGLAKRKRAS